MLGIYPDIVGSCSQLIRWIRYRIPHITKTRYEDIFIFRMWNAKGTGWRSTPISCPHHSCRCLVASQFQPEITSLWENGRALRRSDGGCWGFKTGQLCTWTCRAVQMTKSEDGWGMLRVHHPRTHLLNMFYLVSIRLVAVICLWLLWFEWFTFNIFASFDVDLDCRILSRPVAGPKAEALGPRELRERDGCRKKLFWIHFSIGPCDHCDWRWRSSQS